MTTTTASSTALPPCSGYTRVTYPGELGAPLVRVSYDVPTGWSTDPVAGALAASREPVQGPHGFWANVVTSIDRVSASATLAQVITDLLLSAREGAADLLVRGERVLDVSGTPAVLREQSLSATGTGLPIVQFVLVALVDVSGGAARDCVQITGSIDELRRDTFEEAFRHLVESVTLDA